MKKVRAMPTASAWLIQPEWMERLAASSMQDDENPGAVLRVSGDLPQRYETMQAQAGRIAIVGITGVLGRYDSWYSDTSVDQISEALEYAVSAPDVAGILLRIDSPGGEANGVSEMAQAIARAATKKPLVAYVDGYAASGAYWLASAAPQIVINETGWAGSIGALIAFYDMSEFEKNVGFKKIRFVSAQSPNKAPDPASEVGAAAYQKQVDDLATVFVEAVASNRKIPAEEIPTRFGGGAVYIGAEAVSLGLADRVGNLDLALDMLGRKIHQPARGGRVAMTIQELKTQFPEHASALMAEGAASERARIMAIVALNLGKEDHALAAQAIEDGTQTAGDVAVKVLAAQTERRRTMKAARTEDAQALAEATVATGDTIRTETEERAQLAALIAGKEAN